jgi:secondary thiamine-phosphate synthase enzyme
MSSYGLLFRRILGIMIEQEELHITTRGRGSYDISERIQEAVRKSGIRTGICHLFIKHTSASLMLCENADPAVRRDLETFMARQVPDGDPTICRRMFVASLRSPT